MGPIRIAILECDIPIKSIVDEFGTYGDLFEKNLTEGAEALDSETKPQLQFSRFNIVDEPGKFPALEDVDAVLLTGSSMSFSSGSGSELHILISSQDTMRTLRTFRG